MTTKCSPPELRPKKLDILVAAVVLVLAVVVAVGFYGPKLGQSDHLTAVISVGEAVIDRVDLTTLNVLLSNSGAEVILSDCPTQDCVHTGHISRAGQSIVCLPGQVVIHLEGASDDGAPDIVVG